MNKFEDIFFNAPFSDIELLGFLNGDLDDIRSVILEEKLEHDEDLQQRLDNIKEEQQEVLLSAEEMVIKDIWARLKTAEPAVQEKMLESMQSMTDKLKQYPFVHETINSLYNDESCSSVVSNLTHLMAKLGLITKDWLSKQYKMLNPELENILQTNIAVMAGRASAASEHGGKPVYKDGLLTLSIVEQMNDSVSLYLESSYIKLPMTVKVHLGDAEFIMELKEDEGDDVYGSLNISRDERQKLHDVSKVSFTFE